MSLETEATPVADNADIEIASAEVENAAETQPDEQPTEEASQDKSKEEVDVPFPKKAKNAISYRDKQIAKARAQYRELEAKYNELMAQQQPANEDSSPREENYESYSDYLEAKVLHKIKSEQAQQQQPKEDTAKAQYNAQREQEISVKAQEYMKSIPDYAEVFQENADIIDYLPAEIQQVFYDADDAALAFYNLAKSGELVNLAEMSPTLAAMKIAQAQVPVQRPVLPKHQPMQGAKGTGRSGKSLVDMTPDEIAKKYKL